MLFLPRSSSLQMRKLGFKKTVVTQNIHLVGGGTLRLQSKPFYSRSFLNKAQYYERSPWYFPNSVTKKKKKEEEEG